MATPEQVESAMHAASVAAHTLLARYIDGVAIAAKSNQELHHRIEIAMRFLQHYHGLQNPDDE